MFVGFSPSGNKTWTCNPEKVIAHFCDCWRRLHNSQRAHRERRIYRAGERISGPLGARASTTPFFTAAGAARSHPGNEYLMFLPSLLLKACIRHEDTEWFAGLKRKKTAGGAVPGFISKSHDPVFICLANRGTHEPYITFEVVNRRKGVITFGGDAPKDWRKPGHEGERKWRLRIFVRISEPIRPFTSIILNNHKRTVSFVNKPVKRRNVPKRRNDGIGLDFGVRNTVALSDGTFLHIPMATEREKRRRRFLQKKLSRQDTRRRGCSHRRNTTHAKMAKLDRRLKQRKNDWIEKTTTDWVLDNRIIVMEDLRIRDMTRRPKPRIAPHAPLGYLPNGKGRKSGLNRSIQSSKWGMIRSRIEQKGELYDCRTIRVDPRHTSITCSVCGGRDVKNRRSQSIFECRNCGYKANADTNAAIVIRGLGMRAG